MQAFQLRFNKRYLILFGILLTTVLLICFWKLSKEHDLKGVNFNEPVELFGQYSKDIQNQFIETPDFSPLRGKKAICFFSLKCTHCRKGAQQISIFAKNQQLTENFLVFFSGREINVEWFYNTSDSFHFSYKMMTKEIMSTITGGEIPQLLLLENGVVIEVLDFDKNTEYQLINFFNYEETY